MEDKDLRNKYAKVVKKFLERVSVYKIYKYNLFKRSAYDAKFFHQLFGEQAKSIYSKLYNYEPNPYTLQQWALCEAYEKNFKTAFKSLTILV